MGSECCKIEKNPDREIYTLETLETEIGKSKSITSNRRQKSKEFEIFSTKKKYNELNIDLKNLLTKKFSLIDKNIKFEEISIEDFENILNKNKHYKRIINNLSEDLDKIFYEEDNIVYEDIVPIKIYLEPNGKPQYFQGNYNIEGKAVGQGILIKNNDIYFGNFSKDKFNGKGIFINSKGNYYFGDWKNNKIEGKGQLIIDGIEAYKGDFKKNKKDGKGIENYKNFDVYYGDFKNNKKIGNGKYIFSNGDIYEGEFNNAIIDGKGKIKFKDGKIYEGNFKKGKIEGKGQLNYDNGIIFKGEFIKNKKEGKGEYIWPDGKTFQGNWKDDIPEGNGIFEDLDNELFEEIIYENGVIKE